MDDVSPPHQYDLLEHAKDAGLIGVAGLATMLLCVAFLAVWPYIVARRHKPLLVPLLVSAGLGLGGYVAYDWQHVSLNLAMHDPQQVREDCEELIRIHKGGFLPRSWKTFLSGTQLPASIARLGAREVVVSAEDVRIFVSGSSSSGGRGFLYDPKRASTEHDPADGISPIWYRDFYEYGERYE